MPNQSNWIYLKKYHGNIYLALSYLVIGLGVFLILYSAILFVNNHNLVILFLTIIGLSIILLSFHLKNAYSAEEYLEEGVVRFSYLKIQLLINNTIKKEIVFDENTIIIPIVNHFLGGYNKLWGFTIKKGDIEIDVEPNLGFLPEDIQKVAPIIIEICKKRNVKFHKYWKYIKIDDNF